MSTITIADTGNAIVGLVQGLGDIAKDPGATDKASALLTMAGGLSAIVGSAGDSPFLKSLTTTLGVNLSATGLVMAGIQLNNAIDAFNAAKQSGNASLLQTAQIELFDKSMAFAAAIGGAIASIPTPTTKAVGLTLWGTATGIQQIGNGNAARALEIMGATISEMLANQIGGEKIEVNHYQKNGAEFLTIGFYDRYGITQGEFGRSTGKAANAEVWIQDPDGWIVDKTVNGKTTTFFVGASFVRSSESLPIPQAAWSSALQGAQYQAQIGQVGISTGVGNTVDFLIDVFGGANLDWQTILPSLVDTFGSNISQYVDLMSWFNQPIDFYQSIWDRGGDPDVEADAKLVVLTDMQHYFGVTKRHQEIVDLVAGGISSPIVIDLHGDGIVTSYLEGSTIKFDLTNDGKSETVGWLSGEDGFLVMDHNLNGIVDNAGEMFGGANRGEGYAKLSTLDSNGDRLIDSSDENYQSLLIWQDKNQNGITDAGELTGLSELGVSELRLDYVSQDVREKGNLIGEVSSAVVNGRVHQMADVYFRYRNSEASNTALIHAMAGFSAGESGSGRFPVEIGGRPHELVLAN